MKTTIEDDQLMYYDYLNDNIDQSKKENTSKVKALYISCLLNMAGILLYKNYYFYYDYS